MKNLFNLKLLLLGLLLWSCSASKPKNQDQVSTTVTVNNDVAEDLPLEDTLSMEELAEMENFGDGDSPSSATIPDSLPIYHAAYTQTNDLIHTKLDLKFDWANRQVNGKALLTIKPYFKPVSSVTLDAKNLDIKSITFEGKSEQLKYSNDGTSLVVQLGKTFNRQETYKLAIDYTGNPEKASGFNSEAITSNKGLFFINHDGKDKEKPMQIWTQGETEWNSRWMPTIDKPLERCTQEVYLTVEDKYKTLSNGVLVSSKKNTDGTRTDYWKMDLPHAPYLFMLAVGEFAVVQDKWERAKGDIVPLMYYVEPKFEKEAKNIFPYTPELLSFFSQKLGVKYPWPKYAQIVVRDYVSGAMENTTSVIFGDFMQKSSRELIDVKTNELVVAHEMFHHWFGDLVTCESWSNLTLNEGFANYSEYLWLEHKYGRDEADKQRATEFEGYLGSVGGGEGAHPLIHFHYSTKEDMFDAHSYNKGGLALHMLRSYLGDDVFFIALKQYLEKHQFTAVEVDELRMAFEDVSGEDLHWFFDQYYLKAGHPELFVASVVDNNQLSVSLEQTQDPNYHPAIFKLPVTIEIHSNGSKKRETVWMTRRKQTFTFPINGTPDLVVVDPDDDLLAVINHEKDQAQLAFQYKNVPGYKHKAEALNLLDPEADATANQIFKMALSDPFWDLRRIAATRADVSDASVNATLIQLAKSDAHSEVRATALTRLTESGDNGLTALAKEVLAKEQAYPVLAQALSLLAEIDPESAKTEVSKFENDGTPSMVMALGDVYGKLGDPSKLSFFEKNLAKVDGFEAIGFFGNYTQLLVAADAPTQLKAVASLKSIGTNQEISPWKRFSAAKALFDLFNQTRDNGSSVSKEAAAGVNAIKQAETNQQLRAVYNNFVTE